METIRIHTLSQDGGYGKLLARVLLYMFCTCMLLTTFPPLTEDGHEVGAEAQVIFGIIGLSLLVALWAVARDYYQTYHRVLEFSDEGITKLERTMPHWTHFIVYILFLERLHGFLEKETDVVETAVSWSQVSELTFGRFAGPDSVLFKDAGGQELLEIKLTEYSGTDQIAIQRSLREKLPQLLETMGKEYLTGTPWQAERLGVFDTKLSLEIDLKGKCFKGLNVQGKADLPFGDLKWIEQYDRIGSKAIVFQLENRRIKCWGEDAERFLAAMKQIPELSDKIEPLADGPLACDYTEYSFLGVYYNVLFGCSLIMGGLLIALQFIFLHLGKGDVWTWKIGVDICFVATIVSMNGYRAITNSVKARQLAKQLTQARWNWVKNEAPETDTSPNSQPVK